MADYVIGTRDLVLKVGGTDVSAEVSKVVISESDDSEGFPSFAAARTGGARKWTLKMTLRQNTSTTSLWYYGWTGRGTTLAVELWPRGGATAAPATPKVSGSVLVGPFNGDDMLGGEANPSATGVFTTELAWDFTAQPTIAVA